MQNTLRSILPFTSYPYTGVTTDCNLCGSSEAVVVCEMDRRWKKLTTVSCADCGLLRTDPMPTEQELEQFYSKQYRFEYQLGRARPPRFHVVRSMREAQRRAARLDAHLRPGAKVLDAGCGSGEFLHVARQRGCDVVGIEPGRSYAEFALRAYDVPVHVAAWRDVEFAEAEFDVITTHHVIEHLRDPVDALGALARWLKPDGVLYVSVPDMTPNSKPAFERFHFAHTHGFVPATLQAAARCHGLTPVDEANVTTTVVFRKSSAASPIARVVARDRTRAQLLVDGYRRGSIIQHVMSGQYFTAAFRRLNNWMRDSFAGLVAAAPILEGLVEAPVVLVPALVRLPGTAPALI